MSAPVKERPVDRRTNSSRSSSSDSLLQSLQATRAEIEQAYFRMWERFEAWDSPPGAYNAVEFSKERLKTWRVGIKALEALRRYVDALIDREVRRSDG